MTGDTVGRMLEVGSRIRWECLAFPLDHSGPVDLQRIVEAKGADYTLANRRPRCLAPACPARVRFVDRTSMYHRFLDTITDRDEAWWTFNDAERERLQSAGFEMVMGKWVRK